MIKANDFCIQTARELYAYDPETGLIRWRVDRKVGRGRIGAHAGDIAGHINDSGYRNIVINNKHVRAHRVAWAISYGEHPPLGLDHINGIRDDNRLCNLRQATISQNGANLKKPATNTSGLKGACWSKAAQKWQAQIRVRGQSIYLGLFATADEAHQAYVAAARDHHGEYASDGVR